jgi:hypothetical protein
MAFDFRIRTAGDPGAEVLSIDAVAPAGPTLSHRPGNRTADAWRGDSAAEVVSRWLDACAAAGGARDPGGLLQAATERGVVLGPYGAGAAIAAYLFATKLEPGEERNLLLAAAVAADYGCFNLPEAVQIALILQGFSAQPPPRLRREMESAEGEEERQRICFGFALEQIPKLLREPDRFPAYWRDSLAATQNWIEEFRVGRHRLLAVDDDLDLVQVLAAGRCDRRALRTIAPQSRTLVSEKRAAGWRHEFTYEVESYFDMESLETPPRHALASLAVSLSGADRTQWNCDAELEAPVVQLRGLGSRLAPEEVREAIVAFLEKADGIDIDW